MRPEQRVVLDRSAGPSERWLAAVALGGQGRYAAARAVLRPLRRCPDPVVRSLAASTEGSLWRQLGWHRLAGIHDGRALLELGGSGSGHLDAQADALIGLAADSIGANRLERGLTLLSRCALLLDGSDGAERPRIRMQWVHAEIALAQGRCTDALQHAEHAAALSRSYPSVRHAVKSDLLVAAAQMASGRSAEAARDVRSITSRADVHGLLPLAWASSMLGVALGDEASSGARDRYCATIRQRGGVFRSE
ncbi:hypothetical protein GCM10007304_29890 [Rhodococcoides trifolii]|uniref:Uncharacterized protein n=1 Tax=Rhodococcoides trifolii TaxID=908250 RepID=A0A917LDA6_9NOCA|nr:hypothetical protein [Rhodococcus trifolii]GGG13847.1 hypothetical protein GCM10007304_29890 [Rhodococcus trifolii]